MSEFDSNSLKIHRRGPGLDLGKLSDQLLGSVEIVGDFDRKVLRRSLERDLRNEPENVETTLHPDRIEPILENARVCLLQRYAGLGITDLPELFFAGLTKNRIGDGIAFPASRTFKLGGVASNNIFPERMFCSAAIHEMTHAIGAVRLRYEKPYQTGANRLIDAGLIHYHGKRAFYHNEPVPLYMGVEEVVTTHNQLLTAEACNIKVNQRIHPQPFFPGSHLQRLQLQFMKEITEAAIAAEHDIRYQMLAEQESGKPNYMLNHQVYFTMAGGNNQPIETEAPVYGLYPGLFSLLANELYPEKDKEERYSQLADDLTIAQYTGDRQPFQKRVRTHLGDEGVKVLAALQPDDAVLQDTTIQIGERTALFSIYVKASILPEERKREVRSVVSDILFRSLGLESFRVRGNRWRNPENIFRDQID